MGGEIVCVCVPVCVCVVAAKAGKGSKAKAPPPPAFSPATMRRQAGQLADAVYTEVMGQLCLGLTQLTLALQMEGETEHEPACKSTQARLCMLQRAGKTAAMITRLGLGKRVATGGGQKPRLF